MKATLTAALLATTCLAAPAAATEPMQHATERPPAALQGTSTAQTAPSTTRKTKAAEWLRLARLYRDSGHPEVWAGVPKWIRDLGLCIRRHESMTAGHYQAENPTSTASGAYQMLAAMWRGNAKWIPQARQYRTAGEAPAWVQDLVFIHSITNGGAKHWRGTGCKGT